MANYKRKKCRREVRCTMCTKVRWLGNRPDRRPINDLRKMGGKLTRIDNRASEE